MQIIDNVVILALIVLAFIAGKLTSDRYHEKLLAHHEYTERLMASQNGVGYVALPEQRKSHIGQPFMDRLKENGHATQALK